MRVTEVNLIPRRGYLLGLKSICVDHHGRSNPKISNPETLPVSEASTLPTIQPLTCVCASALSGIQRIVSVAACLVIEMSEVKRVSGAEVHSKNYVVRLQRCNVDLECLNGVFFLGLCYGTLVSSKTPQMLFYKLFTIVQ